MTNILDTLTASKLLAIYNLHSDKPVKRFIDSADGRKRLTKLLATIEVPVADAVAAVFPDLATLGAEAVKRDDAQRDAAKPRRNAPVEKAIAKLAAKKAAAPVKPQQTSKATAKRAAKAAKATTIHVANGDAKAPTGAKATILAMIARKGGVSEPEVCQALGWPRAGGTISRAIKVAPFAVKKVKGEDGRTRYCAA